LLVTVHPATARPDLDRKTVDALLGAVERFRDRGIVFTGVNADPGNAAIDAAIRGFIDRHPDRSRLFVSLGTRLYLAALRHADAVVGNSSSGIIEAPAVGTPSINIGERQTGRLRAASVIDCKPDAHAIAAALKKALASGYRRRFRKMKPPYGRGGASARIARVLRTIDIASHLPKRFHDIPKNGGKDRHS